jgi:hypothetical protein
MDKNRSLLPWYFNHTLSESERSVVETWLQSDPDAKARYQGIRQSAQIITTQEEQAPPAQVRTRLLAQIRKQPVRTKYSSHPWIWGVPMMLLIFILLWLMVQPGTQLQWTVSGNTPADFRIYRAPAGSGQFTLIEEMPAAPAQQTYQYADYLVVPGQNYQYRIEVRDQSGNTSLSQTAVSDSLMTLAAQIAILLTSFMLTFGIITVSQEIRQIQQSYFAV